jgi:caa(3)-type oxidase subunit IV
VADTKHDAGHGEHHGNLFKLYMIVAGVLAVATASSFAFNAMARHDVLSVVLAFLAILTVAIVKAVLVGMYFMHLKWDWKALYFLIIPAFILGAMMMVVFMPDALLGPSHDRADEFLIRADQEKRLEQQR